MLNRLYSWYGKTPVRIVFGIVVVLVLVTVILSRGNEVTETADTSLRTVTVATVSDLNDARNIELVGSVESLERAAIRTEASGQVTNVHVSLGDTVRAGSIIAELENASQYAAMLQAEGVYEAALAAAGQSDVSVIDAETSLEAAKTSAVNTYRSSFSSVDDVLRNTVDVLFSDPEGATPGFRIDSLGNANYLNNERKVVESILDEWAENIFTLRSTGDVTSQLETAKNNTDRILTFVELISQIASDDKNKNVSVNGSDITAIRNSLVTARTTLNGTLQNIENARSTVENAAEALTRAELGGTGGNLSAANAQVKQALGALRAAEANFAKTVIRTPISGTVNLLNIKTGDFVASFDSVATIANNNALEVTTFVGESDRSQISTGDMVRIEDTFDGIVTTIAPAVDPGTKKIEVTIQTETDELSNGDTVRVTLLNSGTEIAKDAPIVVPITALKVGADETVVFTVEDGVLVPHTVSVGPLLGSNIVIAEGATRDMHIVTDARGFNAGDVVTVK